MLLGASLAKVVRGGALSPSSAVDFVNLVIEFRIEKHQGIEMTEIITYYLLFYLVVVP